MLKNNLITTLSVLFTASILFISCKKDNHPSPVPDPDPVSKKIWKIKTNENDSTLFAYTTTGELHKVITTEEGMGNNVVTYTFIYTPDSKLSEISSTTGLKYKFLYESNTLKLTENYLGANKLSENHFEYSNNKVSAATVLTAFPGNNGGTLYKPTFKTTYTYDAAGQLKKVISYTVNPNTNAPTKVNEKEINQYDNNKNPLGILSPLSMVHIHDIPGEHNIIKETLYGENMQVEEITLNSYVYDKDNYPVTSTSTATPAGGTPSTINFKYYYK